MAKKQKFTKEYLEQKLNTLIESQQKIEKVIDEYMELYQRLSGAIEVTKGILLETDEENENENLK